MCMGVLTNRFTLAVERQRNRVVVKAMVRHDCYTSSFIERTVEPVYGHEAMDNLVRQLRTRLA